uniref:Uncharacterized protein n=1 Tax=Rhizophora mucronata TaxID=61149 RepID=A0A2P2PRS5_RHIMU
MGRGSPIILATAKLFKPHWIACPFCYANINSVFSCESTNNRQSSIWLGMKFNRKDLPKKVISNSIAPS